MRYGQRGFQFRRSLHASERRGEPAAAQGPQRQFRVVVGVRGDQDFDRLVHMEIAFGGGCFINNQKILRTLGFASSGLSSTSRMVLLI